MLAVIVATVLVGLVAAFVYIRRERLGLEGVGLAALRTVGLVALLLLLLNPARTRQVAGGAPTVLLDASLSMDAAGGRWRAAVDSARARAGADGAVLRFGDGVEPFDTLPPSGGVTHLRQALAVARARGGPTLVVTDGEIADAASLPPALLLGLTTVVLPRDTAPDVALLDVALPERIQRDDSLTIRVLLGTWGGLGSEVATLEVLLEDRRLLAQDVTLPPPPGTALRTIALPPGLLDAGEHVLRFRIAVSDDAEPRNNERLRPISVSELPAVVVIVDPADWEGRFLVRELTDIVQTPVRGYARAGEDRWVDMHSSHAVSESHVRASAEAASLVIVRGAGVQGGAGPTWHWPAGTDARTEFFGGDWYIGEETPASPLAGRFAAMRWDSLPPLTGVVPLAPVENEWVVISARQGRRGTARPVLVGSESRGARELTTAGAGLWRWGFRGGAAREGYRALLAAGVDWLLGSAAVPQQSPLVSSSVVARGVPATFQWRGGGAPDSLDVTLASDGAGRDLVLRFDADGVAHVRLDPGVYRWSAPAARGATGLIAVEAYSPEFHPARVADIAARVGGVFTLLEEYLRQRWWLFFVVVLAFSGEWAWRLRRGLP